MDRLAPGMPSYIGTDLSNSHPVSFAYEDSVSNPLAGLEPLPPDNLVFYGFADVQCPTCHDAHSDEFISPDLQSRLTGKFLVMDNSYSDLCVECHGRIGGWNSSGHKNSTASVTGVLPLSTPEKIRDWPTWPTVTEWGCESCHTAHGAGGAERLLYYREEEKNCYLCHNGSVATSNIEAQFQKMSEHPVGNTTIGLTPAFYHDPTEELLLSEKRHVECVDCHNPHATSSTGSVSAPLASGMLAGVGGIGIDNTEITPVINEYEICFRCHGESAPLIPFLPRVIDITNTRLEFAPSNQSYHPVASIGKNTDPPPSLDPPSPDPEAPVNLTSNSIIYCTDCHSDDGNVSRGPHGSMFAPILKRRYETTMGTPSTFESYSLCYRCHNETSIMSDASFRKAGVTGGHSGHVQTTNTPCSVCHDPHGVSSNRHLINFDTRYVKGPTDSDLPEPTFIDGGLFTGSCTLVCHYDPSNYSVKVTHVNATY
jgi:predicted CXXCH cytochrome family protein